MQRAIAELLPRAVELAEKPTAADGARAAAAPLGSGPGRGLKVVLTGEGADELFAGYDIFREDKVRRFWARDPSSTLRPLLFARLNRFLAADLTRARARSSPRFYGRDLPRPTTRSTATGSASRNTARCLQHVRARRRRSAAEQSDDRLRRLIGSLPSGFAGFSRSARRSTSRS